ncbi:MAG: helix-turn-helix domain-containing protein [Nitrospinae bacterium]|nr:helix-turn-helix domain-containing protein [Nitrospinota bacterium]
MTIRYDRAIAISKRHEALLALVRSGSYSSPALAKKLGVSEPTVYRDILFLKRQGHRIESVRLSSNWAYQLPPEKKSNNQHQGGRHL